jgi:DNA-binding response OmpR family regulator
MRQRDRIRALVVTADSSLASSFSEICRELEIEAEPVRDFHNLFRTINEGKYDAVLLDADTVPAPIPLLNSIRESRSNKGVVTFVIATKPEENAQALARGAYFVFRRPVSAGEIRHACRAAYDLMLGESRRYFRTDAQLPAKIATSKATVECSTINVSANGLAVRTAVPLDLAATVDIELRLPDGFAVRAAGLVVWHDRDGNSGLRFHCSGPEMREKLDSWLDSQYSSSGSG